MATLAPRSANAMASGRPTCPHPPMTTTSLSDNVQYLRVSGLTKDRQNGLALHPTTCCHLRRDGCCFVALPVRRDVLRLGERQHSLVGAFPADAGLLHP